MKRLIAALAATGAVLAAAPAHAQFANPKMPSSTARARCS